VSTLTSWRPGSSWLSRLVTFGLQGDLAPNRRSLLRACLIPCLVLEELLFGFVQVSLKFRFVQNRTLSSPGEERGANIA
jgi:hypothetical protein